jgi:acyl-CoA thioester hydrolase
MRVDLDVSIDPNEYSFSHDIRVRFAETDAMGVMHHSSYVAFLEETRVEYLRSLGRPYGELRDEGFELAVLEIVLQYRQSARFEDVIRVHTRVRAMRGASFQMDYLLMIDGSICASGATVHGVVDKNGRATRAPAWLKTLLTGSPS